MPPPPPLSVLFWAQQLVLLLVCIAATWIPKVVALDPYADSGTGGGASSSYQQQQQQGQQQQYVAHTARRERNLDHWDGDTLCAYLGMDPETGEALLPPGPPASSSSSSESESTTSSSRFDEYVGHDAAVLFYAQWCQNCHSLAPSYDAIATHLKAGTKSSGLVMALFDCERDDRSAMLCAMAGVKHYPTILYVGSGTYHDTDPISRALLGGKDKSAGPAGASVLRRTVKFQGDWRYGDQVLDWIGAMGGLSALHRLGTVGPIGTLRRAVLGLFGRGGGGTSSGRHRKNGGGSSLPVGVPPGFEDGVSGPTTSGGTGGGNGDGDVGGPSSVLLERQIASLETDLEELQRGRENVDRAVKHASYIIDSLLFPVLPLSDGEEGSTDDDGTATTVSAPSYIDPFEVLASDGGWDAKSMRTDASSSSSIDPYLLRTCVTDLSLDYCTRVNTRATTAFLDEITNAVDDPNAEYPSLSEVDSILGDRVAAVEPYCGVYDECLVTDFQGEKCRPEACPFVEDITCRYISSCFHGKIRGEYEDIMGEIEAAANADYAAADAAAAVGS